MLRISNCIIAVLFSVGLSFAQDLKTDLAKITKKVDTSECVALVVGVKVYSRKGGSLVYSTNSEMYRNSSSRLTVLGDQEFYSGLKEEIILDDEEKTLLVKLKDSKSVASSGKEDKSTEKSLKDIAKFLEKSDSKGPEPVIKCISTTSSNKVYEVTNIPSMKKMTLTLNMDQLKIVSVTYEYSENSEYKGQYISLIYKTFSTSSSDANVKLKSSNYYTLVDNKIKAAAKYASYKLFTE